RLVPHTHRIFLIGVAAIAGFPGLSGFFSKDEIIVWAGQSPAGAWLRAVGLATSGLTAFYMTRLYCLTFTGECPAPADVRDHVHEVGPVLLWPLSALAACSVVAGYVGLPQVWGDLFFGIDESDSLGRFLAPVLARVPEPRLENAEELRIAARAVA